MSGAIRQRSFQRAALALAVCLPMVAAAEDARKPRHSSGEAAHAAAPTGRVSDVRFWSTADATRVAVEVTGGFAYKHDHLSNPDRIFYDISGVKPSRVPKGIEVLAVNDALVKQIRIAETVPGTTRIVLDLNAGVEATASQLSNPDRLIIEVRPPGKAATALAAASSTSESVPPAAVPVTAKPIATKLPAVKDPLTKAEIPPATSTPAVVPSTIAVETAPPRGSIETPPTISKTEPTPAATTPATKTPEPPPAQAARRTGAGERSMTRVLGLKLGKVVLDPGHGGHDGGTRGPSGLFEKDLVLDVSKRLGALIQDRLASEVVYTREDDSYVPLEERAQIANRQKADLFLSIHANSSPVKAVSGIETYYLNFTTEKSALEVAARENASSERSIHDLRDLVQKIALKDKLEESRDFADHIQATMSVLSAKGNSKSQNRGVKKAPFVVLIGASMPSVLVEIGFVSNPRDESLMKKPEYRQKIAEALYKGIAQYASGLSHFEVAKSKSDE